jgi:tetratricopeptide (TPR) repeat protein
VPGLAKLVVGGEACAPSQAERWAVGQKSAGRDHEGAIQDLNMVLGLYPNMGVAYHERGAAWIGLKRYKEAIADFDRALKDKAWQDRYAGSYILRAKAKRALGDIAGANADERAAKKR